MKHRPQCGASGVAALVAWLCAGCTFEDGSGFATVESAALTAELEGTPEMLNTDVGYAIDLVAAELGVEHVLLLGELTTARPAEGAASCDGDHCHGEDGSLVPAGEAASEGDAELAVFVEFDLDSELDLLAGTATDLGDPEPSAELPGGVIREVEVELTHIRIEGTVTGGTLAAEGVPLRVELPLGGVLRVDVSRELSRDAPPSLDVNLAVVVPTSLFAGIELEGLVENGAIEIDEDTAVAAPVIDDIAAVVLQSTLAAEL